MTAGGAGPSPGRRPGRAAPPGQDPGAAGGFLPERPARPRAESVLVRVVATAGIVGIAVVVGAMMGTQDADAWLVALVVSLISVVLAAVLWRSRLL